MGFAYSIGSILFGFISAKYSKNCIILISFFLCTVSIYVCGGLFLETPASLIATLVGVGGIGFFQAGSLVPIIPLVIE